MNLEYKYKGKVGEIIYPAHNGTNITKVDKKGQILERLYIWDYATIRAIELWIELRKKGII